MNVKINFNSKNEKETRRIWKILKRHFVNAESKVDTLVSNRDGRYYAGSTFQIEGSLRDIVNVCFDVQKIPYKIDILRG